MEFWNKTRVLMVFIGVLVLDKLCRGVSMGNGLLVFLCDVWTSTDPGDKPRLVRKSQNPLLAEQRKRRCDVELGSLRSILVFLLCLLTLKFHEAVGREESQQFKEGIVMEEIQRGFLLRGRVLRPALVKVSKSSGLKKAPNTKEEAIIGQPTVNSGADK
ncbi:hypothetical protein Sjap_021474 [Stephania japonica]|uniref:Uncharacterized protein n=1 Tax=Stephania japonica TaxID=461633 RepID=A0AAP0EQ72_9MAGN